MAPIRGRWPAAAGTSRMGNGQTQSDIIRALGERLPGEAHVGAAGLRLFESDGGGECEAPPAAVVLPGCERELAGALRFCHEYGLDAVVRGAGTSFSGGAVGTRQSIVIATTRLNKIIVLDRRDRRVRAQAGAMLTRIGAAAGAAGLRLPQAPRTPSPATLGGAIAKDVGGAAGALYGSIASRVTGLRLVLADGEILEVGEGELDCGGYYIAGLIAGSEGVLAAVSEATLSLVAGVGAVHLMVAGFADAVAAARAAAALSADQMTFAVMELVATEMLAAAGPAFGAGEAGSGGAVLIIEAEGERDEVADAAGRIRSRLAELGAKRIDDIEAAADADRIWRARETVRARLRRRGATGDCDITVPVGDVADALAKVAEIATAVGVSVMHIARPGEGRVQSVFVAEGSGGEGVERVADALDAAGQLAVDMGGLTIGELGAGAVRVVGAGAGGISAADLAVQQRLKTVFDGNWTMNRGKVLAADG